MINLEISMSIDSRELNSILPGLTYYNDPIQDRSIIGIALIYDEGPRWVLAYDFWSCVDDIDDSVEKTLYGLENEINSENAALEYFEYNVLNSYIGYDTPVFIEVDENYIATRFNQTLKPKVLKKFDSLYHAYEQVMNEHDLYIFVPLSDINLIKELV